jgi:hypothetical protein
MQGWSLTINGEGEQPNAFACGVERELPGAQTSRPRGHGARSVSLVSKTMTGRGGRGAYASGTRLQQQRPVVQQECVITTGAAAATYQRAWARLCPGRATEEGGGLRACR